MLLGRCLINKYPGFFYYNYKLAVRFGWELRTQIYDNGDDL